MIPVAFFDTKSYDRQSFARASGADGIDWRFHEFRLGQSTLAGAEGVRAVCVFVNDNLDRDCLASLAAAGVKHVALRCAGFNNVNLEAARELGIAVTRVPAYSPHAVAEHTVALLQTLNRKIHRAYVRVREQNFSLKGLVGFDLFGKTVGVAGTGKIGRLVAKIFLGYGCKVVAYDPYPDTAWAAANEVEYVPFNALLARSDIVTLHLPLTPESHHLLNADTIAQMKPGAHIVNTSRGKLIDTTALIQHLKTGHLGGVALDVYEEEEGLFFEDHSGEILQDDELNLLLSFANVLITSHQAFLTHEALHEIARVTVENVGLLARGEAPMPGTAL
jgi:D-lactate dehydrogenase